MSYIDDILGGAIDEGKNLVRGYVNDALDPIGEILIDALQALGILDAMESEWQKFQREEMAKYKGEFTPKPLKGGEEGVRDEMVATHAKSATWGVETAGTAAATRFSESYKQYQADMEAAPHQADAQAAFNLLRQVPQPVMSASGLNRPLPIKGGWTAAMKEAYEEGAKAAIKNTVKGLTYESRKFIENLDSGQLLSGKAQGYRFNHRLELAGKLDFAFPGHAFKKKNPALPGASDKLVVDGEIFNVFSLPFFENPKLSESRAAIYSDSVIVNRNEPYKVWMGAKGKQVNLDFNISMAHLLTFADQQFSELALKSIHDTEMRDLIMSLLFEANLQRMNPDGELGVAPPEDLLKYSDHIQVANGYGGMEYGVTNAILNHPDHPLGTGDSQNRRAQVIVYTVYLLDMIRSSVIGSTKYDDNFARHDRRLSHPPITFLTFGALYLAEPFIVKSYSLNFEGKNGYEELSLLPRTINVKLKLESYDQLKDSQKFQGLSKRYTLTGQGSYVSQF